MITSDIKDKIIESYWIDKVKGIELASPTTNISYTSIKTALKKEDILYFCKITSGQPIAEFTVVLSIYAALLQRYFGDFGGVVGCKNIPIVDELQSKPVLFSALPNESSSFKEFVQKIKEEVQEVVAHKNYDSEKLCNMLHGKNVMDYANYEIAYNTSNDVSNSSQFCLNVLKEDDSSLNITLYFQENFVKSDVAKHFLENIKKWIINLEAYLGLSITEIPILSTLECLPLTTQFP